MLDMRTIPHVVHEIGSTAVPLPGGTRRDPPEAATLECNCPEFCELDHAN